MPKIDTLARLLFIASCVFFAFLYGFAAAHFGWWPHGFMSSALEQAATTSAGPKRRLHHQYPARHDLVGVASYDDKGKRLAEERIPARSGVTLLTSYWPEDGWSPGVRLIDDRGKVLHTWRMDMEKIWPRSPHKDFTAGLLNKSDNYIHGSYLFENGDLLFNVEYLGLVRMDARGRVLWRLDRRTHHSVHRSDDGNFWVCELVWRQQAEDVERRFPGIESPFCEERVLQVSPEGKILQELSILEILWNSEHRHLLWTAAPQRSWDMVHLNDVEPLSAGMADQYPLFEAGDLVVSLCFLNLVFVFDPDTRKIKWSAPATMIRQHDPDFIGDGWISVFDNNTDDSFAGNFLGGSRLVAFQPHTGKMRTIYPNPASGSKHERRFYTTRGGKAQLLTDGHWLITESGSARVFEIDAQGRTVWEWVHERHGDGKTISEVLEGTRYTISPETIAQWAQK